MHGRGALAYSTLQPGLDQFVSSQGYISYYSFRDPILAPNPIYIVIGDPIAPLSSFPTIIGDFLKTASSALFLQVSEHCAGVLDRYGLAVNRSGLETDLDLRRFDLKGKLKANLRHWVNTARKKGIEAFEQDLLRMDRGEVNGLSREWLQRKGGKEMALLTRPLEWRAQPDVRFFWARGSGRLLAMTTFDPMYDGGRIYGYYRDIVRCRSDAPHGTSDLVTITAIEKFRREGINVLAMGCSPLASLGDEPFHAATLIRRLFRLMRDYGDFVYSFKGLEFHKKYYRGKESPVYFATTSRTTLLQLRDLIILAQALRLI